MGLFAFTNRALSVAILIPGIFALPQETPNDIVKSNGYIIQHCSTFAPKIQDTLEDLYYVLQPAIQDTHYGTTSAPYKAWFKDSLYSTLIDDVLRDVSIGAPFRPPKHTAKVAPQIVCALKPDTVIFQQAERTVDVYDVCTNYPSSSVMYFPETSAVFVCPRFFLLPPLPAEGNCPIVNNVTNKFEGDFAAFWLSQMYFLLHELVDFYLGHSLESSEWAVKDANMTYAWAFSLPVDQAAFNPLSYVLYVACVDKQCVEFPKVVPLPHTRGRRLGAVLDLLNSSDIEQSQSQGLRPALDGVLLSHTDDLNANLMANGSVSS